MICTSAHKGVFATGGNPRVSRAGSCWTPSEGCASPPSRQCLLKPSRFTLLKPWYVHVQRGCVCATLAPPSGKSGPVSLLPSLGWTRVWFQLLSCSTRGRDVLAAETLHLFLQEVTSLKIRCWIGSRNMLDPTCFFTLPTWLTQNPRHKCCTRSTRGLRNRKTKGVPVAVYQQLTCVRLTEKTLLLLSGFKGGLGCDYSLDTKGGLEAIA